MDMEKIVYYNCSNIFDTCICLYTWVHIYVYTCVYYVKNERNGYGENSMEQLCVPVFLSPVYVYIHGYIFMYIPVYIM